MTFLFLLFVTLARFPILRNILVGYDIYIKGIGQCTMASTAPLYTFSIQEIVIFFFFLVTTWYLEDSTLQQKSKLVTDAQMTHKNLLNSWTVDTHEQGIKIIKLLANNFLNSV